jgi:WD40 repeat protein
MIGRLCRQSRAWVLGGVLTTLVLIVGRGVWAGGEPAREAPPSKEAQAKALVLIKDLYKKEFQDAETDSAAAKSLAASLLQAGKETKEDTSLRFVAFSQARDLALRGGDAEAALEAIELLTKEFVVDALLMKSEALAAGAKKADKEASHALAETALGLIEEALQSDNYEAALSLAQTAKAAAIKAKSIALMGNAEKSIKEVQAVQKEFERVKPFLTKLKDNPNDKAANNEVGKYYCLLKGNWTKGLPYLVKGDDPALKPLADKDLANSKFTKKRLEIGDAWNTLGEKEKGPARKQLLRRALFWYSEVVGDLEGIGRVRVERRMQEIAKEFPESTTSVALADLTREIRKMNGQHNGGVLCVAISPDGKWAASGGQDNTVRIWDVATGNVKHTLFGHNSAVQCVAFSRNSKILASGASDKNIRLWDVSNGQSIRMMTNAHNDWVRGLHFQPDGKQLVSAGDDRTVRIWDFNSGQQVRVLNGHTQYTNVLSVSKDGTKALTGSDDGTAILWDLKNGQQIRSFLGHNSQIWGAALSPDAKVAVTAGKDNTVRVWDATSGKELRRLDAKGFVWTMTFAPDGRRLLTGNGGMAVGGNVNPNGDNSLRLWDVTTGKELRKLDGHTNYVRALAFTPNGRIAISGSLDGTVRLWASK